MTGPSEPDPSAVGTFWLLDLEQQTPGDVPVSVSGAAVVFRRVGPEAAAALAAAMESGDTAPVLERFAGGRRCYVALVDGLLASYGWVSLREEWISELGMQLHLAPGDAYVWDCASLPEYRGQGLYPGLLGYIARELRAEGLRRVWIGADTGKVASQRGITRAGFRPVADVVLTPGEREPVRVVGRPGVDEHLVRDINHALFPDSK